MKKKLKHYDGKEYKKETEVPNEEEKEKIKKEEMEVDEEEKDENKEEETEKKQIPPQTALQHLVTSIETYQATQPRDGITQIPAIYDKPIKMIRRRMRKDVKRYKQEEGRNGKQMRI